MDIYRYINVYVYLGLPTYFVVVVSLTSTTSGDERGKSKRRWCCRTGGNGHVYDLFVGIARRRRRRITKAFLTVLVNLAVDFGNHGTVKRQTVLVVARLAEQRREAESQQDRNEELAKRGMQQTFEVHIYHNQQFLFRTPLHTSCPWGQGSCDVLVHFFFFRLY